ncbi:MAG: PEP-CTERM system TPR-repeat protein PrsT [Gammaproteobacteria bacterium]|nr:PEP-CTERM system TPR-repeat protein PrsT [Gammaproteobacteria bacterium]
MLKRKKLKQFIGHSFIAASLLSLISCSPGMGEQQMLQNAKTYLDKGDPKAASLELRNVLQKNNENAEARFLLGSINMKIGDLTTAEKEFRRAAHAGWDHQQTQLALARIFIATKKLQKLLDEIVNQNTWSSDTRANISALRALAEAGLSKPELAKTTLEEARNYKANALQVLKTTAIFQLAGLQDGNAAQTLDLALSHYPDNTELLLLLASYDIQNKKLSAAADTYRQIISIEPSNLITANVHKAHIGLARLQVFENNLDEAIVTLAPLLKRNENDPGANYLSALISFNQGNYNRASDHMHNLLALAPDHSQSQQLMGKIKYALKEFEQASRHLTKYLKTAPDDTSVRMLLTQTYINLNQSKQARSTLQPVLALNQDDAVALSLLSQIAFIKGNLDEGTAALNKALKSSPNNAQLHKQLTKAYIATGQTSLAHNELKIYQDLSKNTEETQKLRISTYLQAGQIEKALEIAKEMLAKDPKNPNTLALIGSLYADNGNDQQARKHFNTAIQIQENHPAATVGLARIERKNGNIDKAISLYKSLVDSNKAGTIPMIALSEIAAQQKRNNDMLSWLEKARNASPAEIRARMILAKYYLQKTQPQKAEIYTKEAIKQSPENVDLLALHGKVMIAQQRYSEALPPLKKLVAKLPESTIARSLLGETFLRQQMLDNAREHLEKALSIQPDNIIAISLLAETELRDGNLDKSLGYAKALQKKQPEHYIGHMQEGDVWMAKKNHTNARSAYNNAWKQKQTARLAKKLFAASKPGTSLDKAIQPMLTWLKNNPDDYSARFYLATIYQNEGKDDKATREYEKILEQTPDNSTVLNNLAWLYSLSGNPRAMDMAERAYRFAPENPGILDTYGWILVQQGQVEKGQRLIKQAMDIIPGNSDIRYHYAAALLKSGNDVEGKQILVELLKQDKPFAGRADAKRLLENL